MVIVRDPLVHFVAIGALLFAVDRWIHPRRVSEPAATTLTVIGNAPLERRLKVTEETKAGIVADYTRAYGKPPSDEERNKLISRYIDEEILAREGLARGLAKDDPRVRNVLAEKMAFVLEQGIVPTAPTDAELSAWFAANSSKWEKQALIDFTQVFVAFGDGGGRTDAETRARGLLAQLDKGADPAGLGDTFSGGRRYRRRNIPDLAESFGTEFTDGLAAQKENTWVLRTSRFGFHLVRVDKRTSAEKPSLDEVRKDVEEAYRREQRDKKIAEAIAGLRKSWVIEP